MRRVCLIPAAGASSRMRGGDKLLEPVGERPVLRVLADRARAVGAEVIVTVPSLNHARAKALDGIPQVTCLAVPNARAGMSASLKAGITAVPENASGVMVLPGDMPDITAQDMSYLWQRFEKLSPLALQATTDRGDKGHPIIFSTHLLGDFETLTGDQGAFRILNALGNKLLCVALEGDRARLDLDTPEAWAAWRAKLG